jgi:hypothetical protein
MRRWSLKHTNPLTGSFGIQGCDFTFWTCSRVFSSKSAVVNDKARLWVKRVKNVCSICA